MFHVFFTILIILGGAYIFEGTSLLVFFATVLLMELAFLRRDVDKLK
jgi:hypothetical protein